LVRILEIKNQKRSIQNKLNIEKLRNDQIRQEVDKANLQYQSLVYEQNHFKNQIHICKEFEPKILNQFLQEVPQTQ
jgi:signal recognition particle subunit SEC65